MGLDTSCRISVTRTVSLVMICGSISTGSLKLVDILQKSVKEPKDFAEPDVSDNEDLINTDQCKQRK